LRKVFVALVLVGVLLAVTAAPALAINDARVPAENCAPDNAQAVGHPAAPTLKALFGALPVSANNPGVSTGAKGEENSQAIEHCA
jgi:hypothetical protein